MIQIKKLETFIRYKLPYVIKALMVYSIKDIFKTIRRYGFKEAVDKTIKYMKCPQYIVLKGLFWEKEQFGIVMLGYRRVFHVHFYYKEIEMYGYSNRREMNKNHYSFKSHPGKTYYKSNTFKIIYTIKDLLYWYRLLNRKVAPLGYTTLVQENGNWVIYEESNLKRKRDEYKS